MAKCEPYTEFDTPNPQSAYSRGKYQGELYVRQICPKSFIVRAGWMFGGGKEDKKFVAKIAELARQRDERKVVDDEFGSPTFTKDFSRGLLRLVDLGLYGTYHLVNEGMCSRFEFASAIVANLGITSCKLDPVGSAEFPLAAPRPRMEAARNYVLELMNLKLMRPWQEALREYLLGE